MAGGESYVDLGFRESGVWKDREVSEVWEVWGDGEMGRWGDGEMGRWQVR
ncbi:MAG: hypothetical protein F6J94_22950 [Moorea sp. SIO1F2]|nr:MULTISPECIES: hypothetical protein [unclassified Moorena]NEO02131.1 hypothetical protein [Moorena sp. SIO3I7]NEQ57031.1 hypothetical protein [Moorena sp. SIO4A1]NEO07192.1 hypothetical protein [Moorena sp. SIO3I8]NEP22709.1 hypothetical protein [Moorena sp. SIO3I6]NET84669.1 hypothetical protein [Moorena sp. SIO1F2]